LNGSTPRNNVPTGETVTEDLNDTSDDDSFAHQDNNSVGSSVSFSDDEF
jgi:hypothetical protein